MAAQRVGTRWGRVTGPEVPTRSPLRRTRPGTTSPRPTLTDVTQHVVLGRARTGAGVALGYAGLLVLAYETAQWFMTPLGVSLWFPPAALAAALLLAGGVGWL